MKPKTDTPPETTPETHAASGVGLDAATCSVVTCRDLPSGIEKAMCYVQRREWLGKRNPLQPCEKCGDTMQQQLTDHIVSHTAKWKCRICKRVYFYEPNVELNRSPENQSQTKK